MNWYALIQWINGANINEGKQKTQLDIVFGLTRYVIKRKNIRV